MFYNKIKFVAASLGFVLAVCTITTPVQASLFSDNLPSAGAAASMNKGELVVDASSSEMLSDDQEQKATKNEEILLTAGVESVVATIANDDLVLAEDGITVLDADLVSVSINSAKQEEEQYKNLVIAKCNDYVNVRQEPSEDAEILGKLYDKSAGDFLGEADGGWYQIKSGSVTGYVKAEYVVTGDAAVELAKEVGKRLATVNTTTLFVREDATTESPRLGMVAMQDDLSVTQEEDLDGWVKVSIEEGEGYVSTDYVTLHTEFVKAESKAEEKARLAKEEAARKAALAAANKKAGKKGKKGSGGSVVGGGSGAGASVASFALQFVGNPYVYGGSSLTNGTDCSGFTMSVYAHFGVGLPHSSGAQRSCGKDVGGLANAQPGDLVCYSGHVGIYIGGGKIVHASTAKTGIKVSNANYRNVLSVRRIF